MSDQRLPTHQRRDQLADAALRILSAEGSGKLTIKAIAAAVGISDGAVFRHFENKQAIFEAALARFESLLPPPPEEGGAPVERLGRFFVERVGAVQAKPEILGLAFNDRLRDVVGETGAKRVQLRIKASVGFVQRCLVEAQQRGELASEVDPLVVVWMITGAMRGAARAKHKPEDAWAQVRDALFTAAPTNKGEKKS